MYSRTALHRGVARSSAEHRQMWIWQDAQGWHCTAAYRPADGRRLRCRIIGSTIIR